MSEIGIFETMFSSRAMRRFKPDPVPDAVISKVLDAAIRAPSAGNSQDWIFVVITDAAQRREVGRDIPQSIYVGSATMRIIRGPRI